MKQTINTEDSNGIKLLKIIINKKIFCTKIFLY